MSLPIELEMAEKAILGTCLYDPTSVRALAAVVSPRDFAQPALGALYSLICSMVTTADAPRTITVETVTREAVARGAIGTSRMTPATRLPTYPEIVDLVTHGGPIAATMEHARMVREAALNRAWADYGRRVATSADQGADPNTLGTRALEEAKAIRDGYRTDGLPFRTLRDVLDDTDLATYDWVIPGLLERGDRLIITGEEGLGKSTLVRQLALCAAAGVQPFSAERFPRRTVVVVDAENSERQWHRNSHAVNLAVGRVTGVDAAEYVHLACIPRRDITNPRDLADIHAALDEYAPDLVLIGPLYKLVPNAINNDTDAAPLINALDSIHERGMTLVMEAHAGKALGQGGLRNYAPRGSAALLGWPEFGFGLGPDGDSRDQVRVVRWRGDRDERDWPTMLRKGGRMPWTAANVESEARYDYGLRAVDA